MSAVYQLLGFPGTGKLTIAREMVRQLDARGEPAALLDNHATTNLIWSLVPTERRFDPDVMARIFEVRAIVLAAAAELVDDQRSLVLTNFLPAGREPSIIDVHRDLARTLGKRLVAVVLTCDRAEVLARVGNPDRVANLKLADPVRAAAVMDAGQTLPEWPELVELDITGLSPAASAAKVLALADG